MESLSHSPLACTVSCSAFGLHRFLFGVNSSGGKFGVGAVFVVSPHIPASPAGAAP